MGIDTGSFPAWKRERHGKAQVSRSRQRSSPTMRSSQPLNHRRKIHCKGSSSIDVQSAATWSSPKASHFCSRSSNLPTIVRVGPSFSSGQRYDATESSSRTPVKEKIKRSKTSRATQTETIIIEDADAVGLHRAEVHLGTFGAIGKMTIETIDFLMHELENRKQELLVNIDDQKDGVETISKNENRDSKSLQIERVQVNSTNVHVADLGRSHSYEALVKLEKILEARHQRLLNGELLESTDDSQSESFEKYL